MEKNLTKTDKIVSFRLSPDTYEKAMNDCLERGYKTLSAYMKDLIHHRDTSTKYVAFDPNIERMFCDYEEVIEILREIKRSGRQVEENLFYHDVYKKAVTLLDRVRDEHFKRHLKAPSKP